MKSKTKQEQQRITGCIDADVEMQPCYYCVLMNVIKKHI